MSKLDFVLYTYFRSSASFRVRIALNLKKISYESRYVHLLNDGGEQHKPEYTRLNPSHDVPTLLHAGQTIGQSIAIIDYLDRVMPTPKLFPEPPALRAQVLQACEIINSGVQPLHNLRVLQMLENKYQFDEIKKTEWTKYWTDYGLRVFQDHIFKMSGKYCYGDQVTAADCYLVPHMATARRFKVDLAPYQRLVKIDEALMSLDAFKRAAPESQADFPKSN